MTAKLTRARRFPGEELVSGCDVLFFSQGASEAPQDNEFWPHADQNSKVQESGEWTVYQVLAACRS